MKKLGVILLFLPILNACSCNNVIYPCIPYTHGPIETNADLAKEFLTIKEKFNNCAGVNNGKN